MSGGEQQRAAIAVALANEPEVLLADEPTGELDTATAAEVFGALQRANADLGVTVLIVTHDPAVSSVVRRVIAIRDGRTSTETLRHAEAGTDGETAHHAVEYAVLDRARPAAAAARDDRAAGHARPRAAEGRARPYRGLARRPGDPLSAPAAVTAASMVQVDGVTRTFGHGHIATRALRGVSFTVPAGQLVALRGRSGSGKTTLLNIVGGLDHPDTGRVQVAGRDVTAMTERDRMGLRRTSVAFIFQSFGLIPILSAAENVGIPLRITGTPPAEREERVRLMLDLVGLGGHAKQRPGELSGGQQQRVAIARALAGRPGLLLADEPTGQLDSETAKQIMRLLRVVVQSEGVTALVATHDPSLIDIANSVLVLEDGQITSA